MRWVLFGALFALVFTTSARAQSAAEITTRGRPLKVILESVLAPEKDPERAVMLVVDPSRALQTARFATTLRSVLRARERWTQNLRLGIAVLGAEKGENPVPPGIDFNAVRTRAFAAFAQRPRNVLRDVYTPLRRIAPLFAREKGQRTIVLLTHQNGDTEYRLEKAIAALQKSKIRVVVVTREVLLSDSYWYRSFNNNPKPPKHAYLGGSEAAFVEVPWGWIYQEANITNVAGSGFATWGLSRLAGATGGRVDILYTTESSRHSCGGSWSCAFCRSQEHVAPLQSFLALRMKAIEPPLESRRVICQRAGSDPYYKAVLRAWRVAHKEGLLTQKPAMRRGGGGLVQDWDRGENAGYMFLPEVGNWSRGAADARAQAKAANRIAASLRKSIAAGDKARGNPRYKSIAELTYVMLRLTRLNLLYLRAFYRDVAPKITSKRAQNPEPPEVALLRAREDASGFYLTWDITPLCHGVGPFLHQKLPGGNGLDVELRAFDIDYKFFLRRNAHTPYLVALSHMGIAKYSLGTLGKGNVKGNTGSVKRSPTRSKRDDTRTEPERERERGERGGGSSGGESGSATSGGG
ncbi:MAG: hypothetical protein ACYTGZ_13935 [Planctomycetota bacterium]|jgi:hypothetical protein